MAATSVDGTSSMLTGASVLVLLQLISRLSTFVANQLLLRYLTAPLVGLSAQLEAFYRSILFFARESLRVAVQRQEGHTQDKVHQIHQAGEDGQAIVNLGYVAIGLGAAVAVALVSIYQTYAPESIIQTPHLIRSLHLYALSALIELLSEPCFLLMQARFRFGTRAKAESLATLFRCTLTLFSAIWASRHHRDLGVLPFALGQLAYGCSLLLVYLGAGYHLASSSGFSLLPRSISNKGNASYLWSFFYSPTVTLASSMMIQSIVKHLLTQGDTFLISLLAPPAVQGVYALANNYGGLLARLIFQPVEESSRNYFSRILSPSSRLVSTSSSQSTVDPNPSIQEAAKSLNSLLRLYLLLSSIVVSIGPFAAPCFLALIAGKLWDGSGAGEVLGVYCFYVPFLAINGITESFVASIASESEVHRQSIWMGFFSIVFAASAIVFMRLIPLGAQGLIIANIVNMFCRIIWSLNFIKAFFKAQRTDFSIGPSIPVATIVASLSTLLVFSWLKVGDLAEIEPLITLTKIIGSALPLGITV